MGQAVVTQSHIARRTYLLTFSAADALVRIHAEMFVGDKLVQEIGTNEAGVDARPVSYDQV